MSAPHRVAIVHDWMFSYRGGERVLDEILALYPQAELFLLFGHPQKFLRNLGNRKVHLSFLARLPKLEKFYQWLLPLFPLAVESHDLRGFDLVISTSSCVAKGCIPEPDACHISYIHSPMRYAWDMQRTYFPWEPSWFRPLAMFRGVLLSFMRIWDVSSSQRIDSLCANSSFVQRRIALYYGRESAVVFPPVDLDRFLNIAEKRRQQGPRTGRKKVLLYGAWTPYKNMHGALDLMLADTARLYDILAVGSGPCFLNARKKHLSLSEESPSQGDLRFIENPSDQELDAILLQADILLFPGVEDFGIVPVEAMAAGLPVVAPNRGGTRDTVLEGVTGFFFDAQSEEDMLKTLQHAVDVSINADSDLWRTHVELFSINEFRFRFEAIVSQTLNQVCRKNRETPAP